MNVQSLPAHIEDLKKDHMILNSGIICLAETWLSPDTTDSSRLCIPGYSFHTCSLGKGKGVGMYIKEDIDVSKVRRHGDIKIQWLKVALRQLDIMVLYRPPKGCTLHDLITSLGPHINTSRHCLITGNTFSFQALSSHL